MGNFTDEDIALAKKVQDTYGVPASVTLAQYALESGYGKSTVGTNNYFNIKGNGTGGYRDYVSKEQSFMDYGALLSNDSYTSKTAGAKNVREYVQGVKNAGYAEDKNYVRKVMSIISANNLKQYDTGDYSHTSGTTVSPDNGNSLGLHWWGDVVRVVVMFIVIIAGALLVITALGGTDIKIPEGVK